MQPLKTTRTTKVVAIHQPDFFPWMGFFDKASKCDSFLVLDDVQFPKTGGTYCNRVKLWFGGQEQWMTAPVDRRYHGVRRIRDVDFQQGAGWRINMLASLSMNYRKATFYKETLRFIEPLILNQEANVCSYNMHAILAIANMLNIPGEKFLSSSKLTQQGRGTELLVSLVQAVDGGAYICGAGALAYQEDILFKNAGIELIHRKFSPPIYPQFGGGSFTPGLSIIDAFMHCGISGVASLLVEKAEF